MYEPKVLLYELSLFSKYAFNYSLADFSFKSGFGRWYSGSPCKLLFCLGYPKSSFP